MLEADIRFSSEVPTADSLLAFYTALGWAQQLGKSKEQLQAAMQGSWRVLCAYAGDTLVGMGRVVSDGYLNTYLCGLGVLPAYRGQGLGQKILHQLLQTCTEHGLTPQLLCEEALVPHYRKQGFVGFAVGMKYGGDDGSSTE